MEKAITETNRRREKQMKYNEEHGIVPQALNKKVGELLDIGQGANQKAKSKQRGKTAAEPTALYNAPKSAKEFQQQIKRNWNNKCINLLKILSLKKPPQYAISFIN